MSLRRVALAVLVSVLPAARMLEAQSIFVTTAADVVDFAGAQTVGDLPCPDGKVSMREAALVVVTKLLPPLQPAASSVLGSV